MKNLFILLFVTFLSVGCVQTTYQFTYPADKSTLFHTDSITPISISVAEFTDDRHRQNDTKYGFSTASTYLTYPEEIHKKHLRMKFNKSLTEDIRDAAILGLNESGMFTVDEKSDIRLGCRIRTFAYSVDSNSITLVPFFGLVFLLAGAPVAEIDNDISGEIFFEDAKTHSRIYTHKFSKTWTISPNMYNEKEYFRCEGFAELFQQSMNEMLTKLSQKPELLQIKRE